MKKFILLLAILFAAPAMAFEDANIQGPLDTSVTTSYIHVELPYGTSTCGTNITGTLATTAVLTFEASFDRYAVTSGSKTWRSWPVVNEAGVAVTTLAATSLPKYFMTSCSGIRFFRVRVSTTGTGTPTVNIVATNGSGTLPPNSSTYTASGLPMVVQTDSGGTLFAFAVNGSATGRATMAGLDAGTTSLSQPLTGASAGAISASVSGNKALTVAPVGNWAINNQPVAATAATISKAAIASTRHVAVGAVVCISGVAAQGDIIFNLRDGTTGAGTVLFTWRLQAPIGTSKCEYLPAHVSIYGTVNTAMTLESAAAPAATNFASVSLVGYDGT